MTSLDALTQSAFIRVWSYSTPVSTASELFLLINFWDCHPLGQLLAILDACPGEVLNIGMDTMEKHVK